MQVECYDMLELSFEGKDGRNPFTDYEITADFKGEQEEKHVYGFYDGDGCYKVRFMPQFEGKYTYRVQGSFSEETYTGDFIVLPQTKGNHGPVRVANTCHFQYSDGTSYYPVGTTCYAWVHQKDELVKETLQTLSNGYFNKIRFCVFPKHYLFNQLDPMTFPYERQKNGTKDVLKGEFDYTKFNPEHFRRIDRAVAELGKLGIEADLILFHPYDKWGFSQMTSQQDDLYIKYVVARYSAYANVWWSLANEYDLMEAKKLSDWEHFAKLICECDPYNHLRSIHQCVKMYDYDRCWVTHCSIQRVDLYKTTELADEVRTRYQKPVIYDEPAYEGNLQYAWGNISGKELVRRFWEALVRGGYATHGETYDRGDNIIWWSHGGKLYGESQERLRFLLGILKETPGTGLKHLELAWDDDACCAEEDAGYMIFYYGNFRPIYRDFVCLNMNCDYHVEVIDTWNMTIEDKGILHGRFRLNLPGREYIAVRIRKIHSVA